MPEINISQIVRKWNPILEILGVTDANKKLIIAKYAEWHTYKRYVQQILTQPVKSFTPAQSAIDPWDEEDWDVVGEENKSLDKQRIDTLSYSIKILSQLNLEGKKISFDELPKTIFKYPILDNIPLEEYEYHLINDMVDSINKELETKQNLHLNFLIENIEYVDNIIVIRSSYRVN